MDAKPDIVKIGVVSTEKGSCIISVRLPDKWTIAECPNCLKEWETYTARVKEHKRLFPDCGCGPIRPNGCHHRDLDGFEIDYGLDDSDRWCYYFTTNKTNDVLEALSLVKKPVEWVKTHMVKE